MGCGAMEPKESRPREKLLNRQSNGAPDLKSFCSAWKDISLFPRESSMSSSFPLVAVFSVGRPAVASSAGDKEFLTVFPCRSRSRISRSQPRRTSRVKQLRLGGHDAGENRGENRGEQHPTTVGRAEWQHALTESGCRFSLSL